MARKRPVTKNHHPKRAAEVDVEDFVAQPNHDTWVQARTADARREEVARMILEGRTVREMAIQLSLLPQPFLSIKGGPLSPTTIQKDINKLRARWRDNALADITEYKARQIAEIYHAKRTAWADHDLPDLIRLLRLEAEVTGTLVIAGDKGPNWREIAKGMGLDPELLLEFVRKQVEAGAVMPNLGLAAPDEPRVIENNPNGSNGSNGHA